MEEMALICRLIAVPPQAVRHFHTAVDGAPVDCAGICQRATVASEMIR
jgi:hypothetical protein